MAHASSEWRRHDRSAAGAASAGRPHDRWFATTALALVVFSTVAFVWAGGCSSPSIEPPSNIDVQPCAVDADCPLDRICSQGVCRAGCAPEAPRCSAGLECLDGFCCEPETYDAGSPPPDGAACPADMVEVGGGGCIDRFEASRRDATATFAGSDESVATSREGVLPWFPVTLEEARNACACAGKHVCTGGEFGTACGGPTGMVYPYGNEYDPTRCNGIDTYCRCEAPNACAGISPCPYPHCYDSPSPSAGAPASGCGADYHVVPTGTFVDCVNGYGAFDMSGNVWELVDDGSATGHWRAGAYNCRDSETLHRCDHPEIDVLAKGFRCCL